MLFMVAFSFIMWIYLNLCWSPVVEHLDYFQYYVQLSTQKTKIKASDPIPSWQIGGKQWKQ